MAQFPRLITPGTPGGITPTPIQHRPLDLSNVVRALAVGKKAATPKKPSEPKKTSTEPDKGPEGLVGSVEQWQANQDMIERQQTMLINTYGLEQASQMPVFQKLESQRNQNNSFATYNTLKRQYEDWEKYKSRVEEKGAGQFFHLGEVARSGGKSVHRHQDIVNSLQYGRTANLPNAGKLPDVLTGEEFSHASLDYQPSFYTSEDALEYANKVLSPAESKLVEKAYANLKGHSINDISGILKTTGADANNIKAVTDALSQLMKEAGIGEETTKDGKVQRYWTINPLENLQNPLVAGRMQDFLGKSNGGTSYNGKKLKNEDGTFNQNFHDEFLNYTMGIFDEDAEKRIQVEQARDKSFQQEEEHFYTARGLTNVLTESLQASTSFTHASGGLQDVGYTPDQLVAAQAQYAKLSQADVMQMFPGIASVIEVVWGEKSNTAAGMAQMATNDMIAQGLADAGVLTRTKLPDGTIAYDAGSPENYKKFMRGLQNSYEEGNMTAEAYANWKAMIESTDFALRKMKNDRIQGVYANVAEISTAELVRNTPTIKDAIFKALSPVGGDGKPVTIADAQPNVPITFNDGLSFNTTNGLQNGKIYNVSETSVIMRGPSATNWQNGLGFVSATGTTATPGYQGGADAGFQLYAQTNEEYQARLAMQQDRNNAEAIYASPNIYGSRMQIAFDNEALLKKDFANIKVREQVVVPKYDSDALAPYRNRPLPTRLTFAQAKESYGLSADDYRAFKGMTANDQKEFLAVKMFEKNNNGKIAPKEKRVFISSTSAYDPETETYSPSFAASAKPRRVVTKKGTEDTPDEAVWVVDAIMDNRGVIATQIAANTTAIMPFANEFQKISMRLADANAAATKQNAEHYSNSKLQAQPTAPEKKKARDAYSSWSLNPGERVLGAGNNALR